MLTRANTLTLATEVRMRLLLLLMLSLALAGCGSSGGSSSSSDPGAYDRTKLTEQNYETTDLVLYTQHLAYPANEPLVIDDKTGGGGVGCAGRITTTQNGSTFELHTFAGGCAHLNGTYSYRLTTTCQGYAQTTFVCGSTATVEIVMQLVP